MRLPILFKRKGKSAMNQRTDPVFADADDLEIDQKLLSNYVAFCASPLKSNEDHIRSLRALVEHSRITQIGFHSSTVMTIGTDDIIVTDQNKKKRLIGQFIIFLSREKVGIYYQTDMRFININGVVWNDRFDFAAHHPHMIVDDHQPISIETARLCISEGQHDVFEWIKKGDIHLAAPRLIEILETYPTGTPYTDAEHWSEV